MTFWQKSADLVTKIMWSWKFIIIQSCIRILWVWLNLVWWFYHWDPYPFIFLNLALSLQAAYASPLILMSSNRQAEQDREKLEEDFEENTKSEKMLEEILSILKKNVN